MELNSDSFEIKNYELTDEGFLRLWVVGGVPNQELIYEDGRKEIVNEDSLFDEKSISSAIGKHICLNHPPKPINASNYSRYSKGCILQEYSKDDKGALVLAGIVHDGQLVRDILDGKIKYSSASYTAEKVLNSDGIYEQKNRKYNHISLLTSEFTPRAGFNSKIIMMGNSDAGEIKEPPPQQPLPQEPIQLPQQPEMQPEPPKQDVPQDAPQEVSYDSVEERVELLTNWKKILEENNIAIDYNLDSSAIKRQILSIYYPQKIVKSLNTDAILQGFWLNFISNKKTNEDGEKNYQNFDTYDFDNAVESARQRFIREIERKNISA